MCLVTPQESSQEPLYPQSFLQRDPVWEVDPLCEGGRKPGAEQASLQEAEHS
jgi:hypothetical protein